MYVDKDYYINTYGGKLPEEEVQRFVTSARFEFRQTGI